MTPINEAQRVAFRHLPSVEEVLHQARAVPLGADGGRAGRDVLAGFVRNLLAEWRAEIVAGELDGEGVEERLASGALEAALRARVARESASGLTAVVNATGVVLHTGLGRAPVHVEAARAMERAARSYCVLEVDRASGERSQRDDRLSELLRRLTGAEAGIAVNNNAAAVLICLQTFAGGRETILSRGELVEIGGSFRMPDVMERAGTRLVEVGTTNRTRIGDYEGALSEDTGLLLKVHTSNYRVEGFTEEASNSELARLGAEHGVATVYDLGSGLLECEGVSPLTALEGEPLVREAVRSGVDVVSFSGDKLLGGPQAGLIVGTRTAMRELRKNPLYRALRLDKVAIAGLERTLELVLEGRGDEIPARVMLSRSKADIALDAKRLAEELATQAGVTAEAVDGESQPGSGSAPCVFLPTVVVRVTHGALSATELSARLRRGEPSVFARIQDEAVLLDPRTMLPGVDGEGDLERVVRAFRGLSC